MEEDNIFYVTIAGKNAKRIIIYVFADSKLNAVENFRALCSGKKEVGKNEKSLHQKGSSFYKVITEFMAQGEDFTAENKTGGGSISEMKFSDENIKI